LLAHLAALALLRLPRPSRPPLFPYTTLFRSAENTLHREGHTSGRTGYDWNFGLDLRIPLQHPSLPWSLFSAGSQEDQEATEMLIDRKSTRLNSSHVKISYAVFCLKKKKNYNR